MDRLLHSESTSEFDPSLSSSLLEGYEFREPLIAEWLETNRRLLNEMALQKLRDALDLSLNQNSFSDAIGYGLRMVAIDPFDEGAHRRLMKAYEGDGRSLRALRQYELLKRLLESELGVQPDFETKSIYDRLRTEQSAAPERDRNSDAVQHAADMQTDTDALRLVSVLHATVLGEVGNPGANLEALAKSGQDLGGRVISETSEGVTFVFDVGEAADAGAGAALGAGIALSKASKGSVALGCTAGLARRTKALDLRGAVFGRAQRLALTAASGDIHIDKAIRQLGNVGHATEKIEVMGITAWRLTHKKDVLVSPEIPFFGRLAELEFLAKQLEFASKRKGRVTHYVGDAGIGKSRLCQEIMVEAKRRKFGVAHVVCRDNRTDSVPLKHRLGLALATSDDVVERAADNIDPEDFDVLTDLLKESAFVDSASNKINILHHSSDRDLERNIQALTAIVSARCLDGPLLIVIEDSHLAGEYGIEVLCAFAKEIVTLPVLLVTTELKSSERLRTALGATAMDTPVIVSDLRPLSPTESEGLSTALLPNDPDRALQIARKSHGNPLFLVNMISVSPDQTADMPSSILAMVQAQLDRVQPDTQNACLIASLLGQQVQKKELNEIFQVARDATDFPHGLGQWFGDTFHFAHQLIQEATYQLIPRDVANQMHLAAANYFRSREPVRFAEHALRSDNSELAVTACKEAANSLLPQYQNDLASKYIEAGLAADGSQNDHAELYFCRASLNREVGRYEAAISDYVAAESIANSQRLRVQCMLRRSGILKLKGRRTEAQSVLGYASAIADKHEVGTDTLSELAQERGDIAFLDANAEACLKHNAEALRLAETGGHILQRARAMGGMGDAFYSDLRLQSALKTFSSCVELSREHRLSVVAAAHQPMVAQTMFYVAPGDNALREAEDALRFARRAGSRRNEALALVVLSEILAYAADWPLLETKLAEATALVEAMGENRFQSDFHFVHTLHAYGTKREADAVALARKGLDEWPGSYLAPSFAGVLAAATNDPEERRASLDRGRVMLSKGAVSHGCLAFLHFAADAAFKAAKWDDMFALADEIEAVVSREPVGFATLSARRSRIWSRGTTSEWTDLVEELSTAKLGLFAVPSATQ